MAANPKSGRIGTERRAVIDIGSNSVRLVIYDGLLRAPFSICNEKALCGLGRDISDDGRLNPDAVGFALETLRRFARIITEHGNPPVHTIATAAVRDAKDGKEFVAAVAKLGFELSVLSGDEEAKFAAMGALSFEPGATGIVGDMGGGSLELVALNKGSIGDSISLPVGPFNIMRKAPGSLEDAEAYIEKELNKVPFLKNQKSETLYVIGGAWRAVARIHMRLRSYPLSVLHHYELTSSQVLEICKLVSHQSRHSLETIPGIPRRRLDTLPYAAMVLKSVLKRTGAKKVSVSAGGVREGILYKALPKDVRKQDPLIETCRFYARQLSPEPEYGEKAFGVVEPLFDDGELANARIRFSTSLLIDIGAYFHPDFRARHAFDAALRAPFVALSHEERVWSALALFCRHGGRVTSPPDEQVAGLLSWEQQQSAMRFGMALRFIGTLIPKIKSPLKGCRLEIDSDKLIFRAPNDRAALMGETPRKHLDALAAAFEAEAMEIYES